MLGKIIAVGIAVGVILLAILLQQTSPTTVGPFGILVVFILIYLLVLSVLTIFLFMGSKAAVKASGILALKKPLRQLRLRKAYYFASIIALAPVLFIGMQSVGEVGLYDVILVALFVTIACVYISKRTS